MAFKQITDLSADTTISLGGYNKKLKKENPQSVEGYYLGKREVADAKKKSGTSFIYFLQTKAGNLGVWGKTDLDRKMSAVKPGTMIRASFDKMVPTPNGEMYKFKVEVDEDNTIEVAAENNSSNNDSNDDYNDDTAASPDADDQIDDYEAQEAKSKAALTAAERAAKVKALLKK